MNQIALVLHGAAGCGKTQIIRHVYKLLCAACPKAVKSHLIDFDDIRVILTVDDVRIGIESQSNPCDRLSRSLALFEQNDCRIIICATRSRGSSLQAAKCLAPHFEIQWFSLFSRSDAEPVRREARVRLAVQIFEAAGRALFA